MQASKELSDFVGCWRFERDVRHADGTLMQITGTADFEWQGDALLYQEHGTMRLATGQVLQAERRYLWQQGLRIYFDDGRFFHAVPPTGGDAKHWCPPDDYRVSYDFVGWPRWSAFWRVQGPAKSYEMTTDYTPD